MRFIISLVAILFYESYVQAHGYISHPKAIYKDSMTKTSFITTVNGFHLYPDYKWNGSPSHNAQQYKQILSQGLISSDLKDFMDNYINGCPKNYIGEPIDVSQMDSMVWQNDEYRDGLTPSHQGPCEIWIDNEKIFSDDNCSPKYSHYPAVFKIDYSKCRNEKCLLQFYWLALHEPNWQMYKGCVMIKNANQTPNCFNIKS